jgi:hypothetical protein
VTDHLERFIGMLAGTDPGERFLELRYRQANGSGMRQSFFPAATGQPAARAAIEHQAQHADTYVGVLLRDRTAGGKGAVSRSHLLFVEIDSSDAWQRLLKAPAPPSAVVSSGTRGHLHVYWQLRTSVDVARLESGNRKLAAVVGGDLACVDAARILRPPATLNFKHQPPAATELEFLHEARAYDYERLIDGLRDPAQPRSTPRLMQSFSGPASAVHEALRALDSVQYIEHLTGATFNAERKICCPFHDDDAPSLHAFRDGCWTCFGCQRGGTVFDFAGELWGIGTKGREFTQLRERLAEVFELKPVSAPAPQLSPPIAARLSNRGHRPSCAPQQVPGIN